MASCLSHMLRHHLVGLEILKASGRYIVVSARHGDEVTAELPHDPRDFSEWGRSSSRPWVSPVGWAVGFD